MTALVSGPQRKYLITWGVIPGWIFRIDTLVSRAVEILSGADHTSGLIITDLLYLMFIPASASAG